jgi:hypothetical protein
VAHVDTLPGLDVDEPELVSDLAEDVECPGIPIYLVEDDLLVENDLGFDFPAELYEGEDGPIFGGVQFFEPVSEGVEEGIVVTEPAVREQFVDGLMDFAATFSSMVSDFIGLLALVLEEVLEALALGPVTGNPRDRWDGKVAAPVPALVLGRVLDEPIGLEFLDVELHVATPSSRMRLATVIARRNVLIDSVS